MHVLDPAAAAWVNLTGEARGPPPSPRCSFGFAAAGGRLFVFGGLDESGACAGAARRPGRGFDTAREQFHR